MAQCFEFHVCRQPYRLTVRRGFFLLCSFFVILFCLLGVWQLHRYHYKKILLSTYQNRLMGAPVPLLQVTDVPLNDLQFQPIEADGQYVNTLMMLVQNKPYKNKLGFEILTPFKIRGEKKMLLVDRGWTAASPNNLLPNLQESAGVQHITGYIKLVNEYQFILGKNIIDPSASPIVMQKIDIDELSHLTHQSFYPFILRLGQSEQAGFVRDWTITTVLPERHLGYAVQWFLMAIVLFFAYIISCCERVKKN